MSNMDVDDSIDAETLQARIDMSMSFAQDLVASWIKPSNLGPRSTRNIEDELREYMRRPPRLGVGAPVPESAATSRDAAALKQRLTSKNGKKRVIEEVIGSEPKDDSENDGESRALAIRKKVKITKPESSRSKVMDSAPSAELSATLKSDGLGITPPAATEASVGLTTPEKRLQLNPNDGRVAITSPSRSKPKKKKRKRGGDVSVMNMGFRVPSPSLASRDIEKSEMATQGMTTSSKTHQPNETITAAITAVSQPSYATEHSKSPQCDLPETPARCLREDAIDVSLVATPPGPRTTKTPKDLSPLLQGPILNLTGPPAYDGDEDEAFASSHSSPSKKRRRRKKKKKHPDASHQVA